MMTSKLLPDKIAKYDTEITEEKFESLLKPTS